ncbi:DNA-binding LacI/PurR family transcriptional regulator [Rhodococcus sp. SORGH_AS303]|nr:DNA-binding LacI/PurR family transcriptional regulator [Rhodococcus sp. SORGH_AS_0303]
MAHRYRVREIAQQAELSEATVDRVLNDRPGVRPSTREMVARAIADLDGQREQLRFSGRKYMLDVVMSAPDRFSKTFKRAVEAELPSLEHPPRCAHGFICRRAPPPRRWSRG